MRHLLPHIIAEEFQQKKFEGTFAAFTLFVDVSGFTPMTASLMREGSEGAEVLVQILDSIFEPMVDAVYRHGGFISTFPGDAFSAMLPSISALPAVLATAEEILSIFARIGERSTKFGVFNLSVRTGISFGRVDWGIIGTGPRAFYFRGLALEGAASAKRNAKPGDIILDAAVVALSRQGEIEYVAAEAGFFKFIALHGNRPEIPPVPAKRSPLSEAVVEEFLPREVIDFHDAGEFRDVASVFIFFGGLTGTKELGRFVTLLLTRAAEFSGYVKEIEFTEGGVIPCFFGAPVAFENNTERAIDFILAIKHDIGNVPELSRMNMRVGVSYGRVFTGMIGGTQRQQYAVVGGNVNLAARLAAAAPWGEIHVTEQVSHQPGFRFSGRRTVAFKGIADPVATAVLVGVKQGGQERTSLSQTMVGRREELQKLMEVAAPILDGKFGGIVYIYGDPGVGKSQLADAFRRALEADHEVRWCICPSDQILHKSFNPFVAYLRGYFTQSFEVSAVKNRVAYERGMKRLIEEVAHHASDEHSATVGTIVAELERTTSILGALIGLNWSGSLYENLDAKGRYENTLHALKNFFIAESLLRPVVIQIEDGHWLDSDSAGVIVGLTRNIAAHPILLVVTSRYNDDGTLPRIELQEIPEWSLRLKNLSSEDCITLAEGEIGGIMSGGLREHLLEKTQGNPFFTQQMVLYFREHEMLEETRDGWALKLEATESMGLPETINAVLFARIDRLSQEVKDVVKAASVIGQEFEVMLLSAVLRNDITRHVKHAEERRIWGMIDELRYIFKHTLLRDTAYEMQLRARLRELHRLTAEAMEDLYADDLVHHLAEIAYHFEVAEVADKAIEYLKKGGDYAREQYQNQQAIALYDRLLALFKENPDQPGLNASVLLNKGSVLELIGKWSEAEEHYREALDRATQAKLVAEQAEAHGKLGELYRSRGKYDESLEELTKSHGLFKELGDQRGMSSTTGSIGIVYFYRGEFDRALECYNEQDVISHELGNRRGILAARSLMGIVYSARGEHERALDCFSETEAISRELGDRRGLAKTYGSMGNVYSDRREFDRALECFRVLETISRELGDRHWMSAAIGNMGNVYTSRGEYDRALECYRQDEAICRELGEQRGLGLVIGNMGNVYAQCGDYDRALENFQEMEKICRSVGDRRWLSLAIGNIGGVYAFRKEYDRALECFKEASEEHRAIGYRAGLVDWLEGSTRVMLGFALAEGDMPLYLPTYLPGATQSTWRTRAAERAREYAEECVAVAEEISKPDTLFSGRVLLARIHAVEGDTDGAAERLNQLLVDAVDDDQRAELSYWLWKLFRDESRGAEALRLYRLLVEKTPKHEYGERIDELEIISPINP